MFVPVLPYLPVAPEAPEYPKYERRDSKGREHDHSYSGRYGASSDLPPNDGYGNYGSYQVVLLADDLKSRILVYLFICKIKTNLD